MGWINQRPEDSFQATEDCEKMDDEQGDISSWMSMEIVPEEIKKMVLKWDFRVMCSWTISTTW